MLHMKVIKLFLASSIVESEHELSAYINSLNKIYVPRDIFFELTVYEELSNALAKARKRAEYNESIQNSQYFYVIFDTKASTDAIEEFDVALKSFQESGAPKIYTYFMQLPEG
jgi:hypothetical protein